MPEKEKKQTHVADRQAARQAGNVCELFPALLSVTPHLQGLQGIVQLQRADMDSAREALGALCRSHPSQELSPLSSELTSMAKHTEAVAQRCARARGSMQDGLQLHFNGKRRDRSLWRIKLSLFI